jgi:putative methionine-R-sulfoxide reductase with GAF domain
MKETTCKKLQEIGGFALAGGCTRKRMKQLVEMIRTARDYRWVGVYKIIKDEFVIMAETGTDPATYARFPITQGLCGAALDSGKPVIVGDVSKDLRYLPTFHTTRSEIIVPMRNDHRHVLGMLDAESDKLNAFADEDLQFLERAAGLIAHCLHSVGAAAGRAPTMADLIEEIVDGVAAPFYFGQILITTREGTGFVLLHRDDASLDQFQTYRDAENAIEIAKYDDAGNYRPLKTAPNLRHGWRLELDMIEELGIALDYFYPSRHAVFVAWKRGCLKTTALRDTLDRQSGMYRVAAKISDSQINDLVADFCRSNGGCLRTILWKRDRNGAIASTKLPKEKFDPDWDQAAARPKQVGTSRCDVRTSQRAVPTNHSLLATVPLLCQEACNLLVAECRKIVKGESG